MGFLSGVLGAVKDENEVITYDKYITDPEKKLNKVLEKLQSQIGSGREGLVESVGAVREWLEGYEREVNEKIKKFKEPIETMKVDIKKNLNEKAFDNLKNKSLKEQHDKWHNLTRLYLQSAKQVDEARKSLDSGLSKKLETPVKVAKVCIKLLEESAKNLMLAQQTAYLDNELDVQRSHIINTINTWTLKLQHTLIKNFWNLRNNVGIVQKTKDEQIRKLNDAVKLANGTIVSEFGEYNDSFENKIYKCFDDIRQQVNGLYEALKRQKNNLAGLVEQAQETFGTLKAKVGQTSGPNDSIYYNWDMLQMDVSEFVNRQIYGQNKTDGLKGIVTGMEDYARTFAKGKFDTVVEGWVDSILESETIKGYIVWYVDQNKRDGKFLGNLKSNGDTLIEEVSKIVNESVKAKLKEIKIAPPTGSQPNVDGNLSEVIRYLKSYGSESTSKDVEIITSIEDALKSDDKFYMSDPDRSDYRHFLNDAIKTTLYLVSYTSKQVSSQLSKLKSKSNITNLETVIKNVGSIPNKLIGMHEYNFGPKITQALVQVHRHIKALDTLFEASSGHIDTQLSSMATSIDEINGISTNADAGSINMIKGQARKNMENTKSELFERITNVQLNIDETGNHVQRDIDTLRDALDSTQRSTTQAIEDLKNECLRITNEGFTSIVREVRSLFAEGHKADLAALKALVEGQKAEIAKIIEKDKKNGVKGLIKCLYGGEFPVQVRQDDSSNLLVKLKNALPTSPPGKPTPVDLKKFPVLAKEFNTYADTILEYLMYQLMTPGSPKQPTDQSSKVADLKNALDFLLRFIANNDTIYHFDDYFVKLLDNLSSQLTALHPSSFADSPSPLLAPLKAGLSAFTAQLGHAYVNRYSGKLFEGKLVETKQTKVVKDDRTTNESKEELTPEGRNCAKVCLTIVEMVKGEFDKLLKESMLHKNRQINTYTDSVFGKWFEERGYKVTSEEGKHHGELKDRCDMTGRIIYDDLLNKHIGELRTYSTLKPWEKEIIKQKEATNMNGQQITVVDMLDYLFERLNHYNEVCHLSALTSTKRPCSVYEMLLWLSGLPHHPVHTAMRDERILEVIEEINEVDKEKVENTETTSKDAVPFSVVDTHSISLEAYPRKASYEHMRTAVTDICSTSYDILCTIAGHGDEQTVYASDYSNNSMKFHYPASGEACLDMFLDVLRRMLPTLSFLKTQCSLTTEHRGWYDCEYGMNTAPAKWPCKEHSSEEATGQPNTQPKCQPTCEANSKVNCQPTSPLMSYLNDCLPGHLPHQLTKIGCKYECATCPSTSRKGMPCQPPLGFRGFSGSTKTGRNICNVLTTFFDNMYLTSIFTLAPTPPKTLPEHFGFASCLLQYWHYNLKFSGYDVKRTSLQVAIESSITDVSIKLYDEPKNLTKAIIDAYGSHFEKHITCDNAHVTTLTGSSTCFKQRQQCAPYLYTLCTNQYTYSAVKHANLYLSWAIYLPWTFWDLLNNLYNAFCSINCQDWGCRGCLRGDKCKKGSHGVVDEEKPNNKCQCSSIVDCKGVAPTLYQYGFVFGEASTLNDSQSPKKCSDFCSQLKNVLNSQYFQKLFEECDNFLWTIRTPFSYLVLALWLLSLLYLIHIMVIRLDLLHIKSHLHSPSSHRIAAQSLLAAGRVNKLGRVFYLQP